MTPDKIPAELKPPRRWVLWKYGAARGNVKRSKLPLMPNGALARVNDSGTWSTFESVLTAYQSGGCDGVGFVFVPGDGYVGIDIDNCVDEAGALRPSVVKIVRELNTYAEWSPSLCGIHMLCKGELPASFGNGKRASFDDGTSIEVYCSGRYFTMTGNMLNGNGIEDRQAELDAFFATVFPRPTGVCVPNALPVEHTAVGDVGDAEVIDRLMQRAAFRALYEADTSAYGNDHSAADLALCNMIAAAVAYDPVRTDRIFRGSKLMRAKWDERHSSDGRTYGQMTMDKACGEDGHDTFEACTKLGQQANHGDGFIRVGALVYEPDEQIEYLLEGCVAQGGTGIIVGKPKGGKTTFAANLGLAVSRGEDFLGMRTRQGPVLYVALEGPRPEWKRLFRAMGITQEDDLHIFIGRAPQDALLWLRNAVRCYRPVLIIVDTLQRFTRVKDVSDYAQLSNATDPLIELARDSGAALVYVHHAGKGEKADPVDSPLGSTAIAGSVDTVMLIKRSPEHRTIATRQRYGDDLPETILVMDPATRRISLGGSKTEADQKAMERSMLEYFANLEQTVDEATIREDVEGRRSTQLAALRSLVADGMVRRSGTGKRGDPYLYQLAKETPNCAQDSIPIVSGSRVPTIGVEPENQKPRTLEKAHSKGFYSGSQILERTTMTEPETG